MTCSTNALIITYGIITQKTTAHVLSAMKTANVVFIRRDARRYNCNRMILLVFRGMLQPVDPEAPAACAHGSPEHHIPHLPLSAGLQHLVLPERGHLLHGQDRRLLALQLRVSSDSLMRRVYRPYTVISQLLSFIFTSSPTTPTWWHSEVRSQEHYSHSAKGPGVLYLSKYLKITLVVLKFFAENVDHCSSAQAHACMLAERGGG